ncbi:MAG: cellulose synthase family protein, partial [Phycisphaeraceae bacterium]
MTHSITDWPNLVSVALPALQWLVTGLFWLVLAWVGVYGLHRYWLVILYYRYRPRLHRPATRFDELPPVTVQLPMFNEANVARRIIDAACALEYPADKLQIQVLDDSTDHSAEIAQAHVAHWAGRGVDIQYLHRTDRTGFKAGALADALPHATGRFIAIFDADFVPHPGFLKRTVHHFTDPAVGMVQTRWDHLNRTDSILTRSQAIFLDGHFIIEHTARNRSGRWINFNGTAGIWRRTAIESAGGWHHDTLTEDVDLSYRAQLKGWRFVFLPRVACPAELPPEINAFKSQQHRWTKGSIQTAKKLLPQLLRANIPLRVKIEAFFHLTSPMVYLYVTLMVLLFYPAFCLRDRLIEHRSVAGLLGGFCIFGLGTVSATVFYLVSQRAQRRGILSTLIQVPVLMGIGIGIALNNARGCIEALVGHDSPFIRTPKYNTTNNSPTPKVQSPKSQTNGPRSATNGPRSATNGPRSEIRNQKSAPLPFPSITLWMSLLEIAMGLYTLQCARASLGTQ